MAKQTPHFHMRRKDTLETGNKVSVGQRGASKTGLERSVALPLHL